MLQKDSFFRKREEPQPQPQVFRPPMTPAPAPLPGAKTAEATNPGIPEAADRKEAKLVVGPDIKMRGAEITDCDTLVVQGRMEATLDSRVLEITEHGVFQGTIAVDQATIHGRFDGELTVRKQLVIEGTGKVSGKIRYAKIRIQEGAELAGEISVLDKAQANVSVTRKVA